MSAKTLNIAPKYCGPPASGNGGYSSGLIAAQVDYPVEVTLRKPPPMGKDLILEENDGGLRLLDGEVLIAEAQRTDFVQLEVPDAPDFYVAQKAAESYPGFEEHPFPTCFVCGHQRKDGDGLRLFPGFISEKVVATPWIPDQAFAGAKNIIQPEFIWAALDCPGAWAVDEPGRLIVLGRMGADITEPIYANEKYVVLGWGIEQNGRKIYTGTAIYNEDKRLCAVSKGLWIALKK